MLKIKKSPSGVPIAIGIGAGIKKRNLTTKEHRGRAESRRGTQRRRN
jgi:hypothetical protein